MTSEPGDEAPSSTAPDEVTPTSGTVPVQYPWGIQQERYEIVDGLVIVQGDIIVGRAEELGQRAAIRVGGGRWPNNQVRFAFDPSVSNADRVTARAAAAAIEAETPLDFIEIANPCSYQADNCATSYILIRTWDESGGRSHTPGGAGQVGFLGGQQIISAAEGFSARGFQHEFLHAIGHYHEHTRYDRDQYVAYRPECTLDDKEGNFTKKSDPNVDFGSYDFTSIMHYRSGSWSIPNRAVAPCNGHWPLERIDGNCPWPLCTDEDNNGHREFINTSDGMSFKDVDAVWAAYAQALESHEAYDNFGSAIAVGDFDGDQRKDLAIGIPFEAIGTSTNAGAVILMKGTEEGFQPWRLVTHATMLTTPGPSARLGTSLAAGDFDHDGIDDLAIGSPLETVGSLAYAGKVYLMRGSDTGLRYWRTITQATVGDTVEYNDKFGTALVTGDFNGDYIDDLAIGSTGEDHNDNVRAGHVYILRGTGTGTGLAAWDSISQATLASAPNSAPGGIQILLPLGSQQAGDNFGSAMASGRIDSDTIDDLVVAADCDAHVASCAGGVYLYRGGANGMRGWMRLFQSTAGDANDRYGWSLAVGDIDMDGDDDILVGAPYDDVSGLSNVGRVYWHKPQGDLITTVSSWNEPVAIGAGDEFGSSIAIGDTGVFDTIAIGARNKKWNNGAAAGIVFLFKGSDGGNPSFLQTLRAVPGSDEEASDTFGHAVALYTEDAHTTLVVGNPGEDSGAGAVQVFHATPIGSTFGHEQLLRQDTKGTHVP